MKRIIKLTENDLTRIVKRVIKENEDMSMDEHIDWNIKSVNCEGKDNTGSMRVSEDEDGNPTVFIRYCKGDDEKLNHLKRKARHEIEQKSLNENEMFEEEESKHTLRKELHTLVGSEMRLGKRANMSGAEHHTEEHKKAEKKLNAFLRDNPSMEKYLDEVEEHFYKQLYN
jgi:hypothetical protein